ncbi:MAG: ABC transporter permease [bacterium]|nr:ABC transporter permease [bacterium]
MFNLGTVIKFEVGRTLKKPTFWLGILMIPAFYGVFFWLGNISGKQAAESAEKLAKEKFSFEIRDESSILAPQVIESVGGKISQDKNSSIEKVKKGDLDAFYFVPKNLGEEKVQVYGKYKNFNENGKYSAVIKSLLKNSSIETIDKNKLAAVNDAISVEDKLFRDGEEYNPLREMVAPAIFLVVFYFIVVFLSNRMLTSVTEEKENRVTEMILTSISARTLILGKIISIAILGVIQILTLLVPILIALNFREVLGLPDVGGIFSNVNFDTWTIFKSALILIFGLAMTIGFVIALGAAMPTAQEASNYFGFIVLLLMAPFFVMPMFFSAEKTIVVDALTYFPPTSPIALLLRNTLGTLPESEAMIGIGLLVVFGALAIWLAVKIFQHGTLSYGKIVNPKSLFVKK